MTAATYFTDAFSVRPHTLRLNVSSTEDIATNTSTVYWSLEVYRAPTYKPYGSDGTWSVTINGTPYSGTFSYNFNNYTYLLLASGSTSVSHDADGSKTITVASTGYLGSAGGSAATSNSWALDTIPRATQPTVSPTSGNTAATYTITHSPAVNTFYHDVAYSLDGGGSYTNIQTNIVGTDTSTDWTPAHTLLPDSTGVTAIIRLITRQTSGGTIIGTKTVNLPLTVPSSVKPSVSSVAWADDQTASPDMPTLMGGSGRFVQRWSKLKPTVTAAGSGGSTVTAMQVTQNGQTTASGTAFGLPIALSGSVPYSAVATDSRGRSSDAYASTVAVTAYNYPNLPTPVVTRTSDSGGTTPSPTGTYLAITPMASVSSLVFSAAEKNLLEWRVRIKPAGGSYTTVQDWTNSTVSGTVWTTKYVAGTYSASTEYVVEVSIRDLFGKNGFDTANTVKTLTVNVPSESVFMDWDQGVGIGLGKYRQSGILDILGDVNVDGDIAVATGGGITIDGVSVIRDATTTDKGRVELATDAETITGTDTARAVTPASLQAKVASTTAKGIAELATDAETITGTDTARVVTPAGLRALLDQGVAFQARMSSDLSDSGAAAWTLIPFDTQLVDIGGCYNPATSTFTAPIDGVYEFHLSAVASTTTSGPLFRFRLNSETLGTSDFDIGLYANSYISGAASKIYELTAGDIIRPYVYNANGTSITLAQQYGNRFSGKLVLL